MESYQDEIEDFEDDQIEDQVDKQAEAQEEYYAESTPSYEKKDDLYSLFWKVVKTRDSSKVGNLKSNELGMLNITVRDAQKIALLADTLNHPGFADFFRKQAEIILATSASKDGWLPNLFVTTQHLKKKSRESNLPQFQEAKRRKGIFR